MPKTERGGKMGQYIWPCPAYSRLSSGYGNRVHPISGKVQFHDGIDLAASSGTPAISNMTLPGLTTATQ